MPKNMKQEVIFTMMMVPAMVVFMVLYNNYLAHGSLAALTAQVIIKEFIIMGCIAALVEVPVIAPLAQRMAFKIINPRTCKPILVPLTISFCTVCMMCPFMSFIANTVLVNHWQQLLEIWPKMAAINFPAALSWQLLVAGPLVRKSFRSLMAKERAQRVLA